ncbi:unknown [Clostridium sp. CAG:768]|nr:unknown [Clostridium sp. CAG:768]
MPFDVPKAIEALGKATDSGFSFAKTAKEKQSETAILKDRESLQKAVNIAEKIILLTYKYYNNFSKKDKKEFDNLFEDFLKYN